VPDAKGGLFMQV